MSDTLKVITTGSFMLIDTYTGLTIEPETETEVTDTPFIQSRLDSGELQIVVKPAKSAAPAK